MKQKVTSVKKKSNFFPVLLLRWFCHVDDDNYMNPEALLSLLTAFPQEDDVYVGKPSLDKPITAHELLEGNATVPFRLLNLILYWSIGYS